MDKLLSPAQLEAPLSSNRLASQMAFGIWHASHLLIIVDALRTASKNEPCQALALPPMESGFNGWLQRRS